MTRTVASMFAGVVILLLTACGGGHYRTASEAGLTRRITRTMAAFLLSFVPSRQKATR